MTITIPEVPLSNRTCLDCTRRTVSQHVWQEYTEEERSAFSAAYYTRYGAKGRCHACNARRSRLRASQDSKIA